MRTRYKALLLFAIMAVILSCKKYVVDDVQFRPWSPEFAAPLVNSLFTVQDILEYGDSSSLIIDTTGTLAVAYSGTIFSFKADDILQVGSTEMDNTLSYPNPGVPFPFVDTIYDSKVFGIDFDSENIQNVEVNQLKIKDGLLQINLYSTLAFEADVRVTIPHATKNGQPFTYEVTLTPGLLIVNSFDMAGYDYDLTQEDQGFNQIRMDYRAIIRYDPDIPAGTDELNISSNFKDIELDFATGYFGQNVVALDEDTIDLDFFNNTIDGQFQFLDPYLKLTSSNSFGFPTQVDVTSFKSINLDDQTETDIYLEGVTDAPFIIGYPEVMGETVTEIREFTNANSNLESILNDGAKSIVWGMNAQSNPMGPTSTLNFMTHESELSVQAKVIIPLKGYAWDWEFRDTTEINIDEDPGIIQKLTLRIILENGFPADGQVQIYMTDTNYVVLDSIFNGQVQILTSGLIDSQGIVFAPTKTITDIVLTEQRIQHLIEARNLIIHAGMETTDGAPPQNQVIEIKDDYTLGVKLGVKAKILVDPES